MRARRERGRGDGSYDACPLRSAISWEITPFREDNETQSAMGKTQVLVDIEYQSVTETGRLQSATFKGVRDDLMRPSQASESRAE
jgi:hypothetical protein